MATVDFPKCIGLIEVPATAFQLEGFSAWVHSSNFPDAGNFPESPKISFALGQVIVETVAYPDQLIGIHCAPGANTLEGFSDWVYSEEFPQQGNIAFIDGRIFIDMSPKRFETHVKLKGVIIESLIQSSWKKTSASFILMGEDKKPSWQGLQRTGCGFRQMGNTGIRKTFSSREARSDTRWKTCGFSRYT